MKINDIFETAATGMTSVASIGKVEFAAWPDRVELYKRDSLGCAKCVAKIKRKNSDGWRFVTTSDWKGLGNEHFGHLANIKSPVSGKKTVSQNISSLLKQWGITNDGIVPLRN